MTTLPVIINRQLAIGIRQSNFPLDALPAPMRDFATAISQSFNLDPVCIALPMLTIAGGIIGNACRIRLTDDLSQPPALWSAILADDDPRLPRALQLLLQPLIDYQIDITRDLHARYKQYHYDLQDWHNNRSTKSPEPNVRPLRPVTDYKQYFFTEGEYAQIPRYLHRQPRGVLIVQNDLSQWFQTADPRFLSLFDANPHTFDDAKSLPARFALNAFVALTGILPTTCSRRACSPYLSSRFLLARSTHPQTTPLFTNIDPTLKQSWSTLLTSLRALPDPTENQSAPVPIPLTTKAKRLLAAEQKRLFLAAQNQPDPALRAHLRNLLDFIPRISLILQLAQAQFDKFTPGKDPVDYTSPHFIDPFAIAAATRIINWFTEETRGIYAAASLGEDAQRIMGILRLVQRRGGEITTRQLMRSRKEFQNSEDATSFLKRLAQAGIGQLIFVPTRRRSKITFKMSADTDTIFATGALKTWESVGSPNKNTS